ncbi:hypothetical protein Val02_23640 [Virgisporangium aliadipatigenens]|uniref:Uncharacterized protein n=1 Tax=Virgisporangium aliadipatigenens TaxID=741659 RepID=A0A8J4DQ91_9ACTN|nr:hypothetical protein Val02_23640 [Virgisporangium aliadipatigenens]
MARTAVGGMSGDPLKWIVLGSALVGVGLLPKDWKRGLAVAAAAVIVLRALK